MCDSKTRCHLGCTRGGEQPRSRLSQLGSEGRGKLNTVISSHKKRWLARSVSKSTSLGRLAPCAIAPTSGMTLRIPMSKISKEDLAELHEIFDHFDKDKNGSIESSEFSALLNALDAEMSESEVATGLRALDEDGNGTIEFDEFATWWTSR